MLDSRTLSFADEVLALTGGEGVDVVLNSLAGEALVRSLAVLKPFGRFLELGKRDFFANSKIGLRPFRNNISYFGIDADQLLVAREAMAGQVFREMMTLFQKGVFRPLPYRAFRRAEAAEAFRHMQQSRHIGKIVVVFDEGEREVRRQAVELPPLHLDPGGSYLVSGGFGGFGLATAEWLAAQGARSLILIGRSGAASETAQEALERLRGIGVVVHEVKASVAEEANLRTQLEPVLADAPPLKGVVHAAMVIDDGLLCNLDGPRLAKVLQPKAVGAWVLHRLTKDRKLDFFVMYSSATTFIGSPGQGSYVAANTYLETLAAYRRQQGLPALAVSWGPISDVGYLASRDDVREALGGRLGRNELTSAQALAILGDLLRGGYGDVAALELDWKILGRALPAAKSPKFDVLRARAESPGGAGPVDSDIGAQLRGMPREEASELLTELVSAEIAEILGLAPERLDLDEPITEMGLDSLMGLELRTALEEKLGIEFPLMAISDGASIHRLVERVAKEVLSDRPEAGASGLSREEATLQALAQSHAEEIDETTLSAVWRDVSDREDLGDHHLVEGKIK